MTASRTILVDLRAAQFNGDRGIPAYLQSLTAELTRQAAHHRWLLLHDPQRPLPARDSELTATARWCTAADFTTGEAPRVDTVLTGCFFLPHHTCDASYLWPSWLARQQPRRVGIVYDLIPLIFPERYLARPRSRRQYHDLLRVLRHSDRLYTISKATRRDTIRHAAVDPARVRCIYGDIDHQKRHLMLQPATATTSVPSAYGLHGLYCICIGGDDWRKNMDTAIRCFAAFHATYPAYQLAIVCKLAPHRITELHAFAARLGLPEGAVVCTGFVRDEDLVALLHHAAVLIYPSRYEGLGLPVLEAYGCGTPVVGSNTSSIAELVLPDLTCAPDDYLGLADRIRRVITDASLRKAALVYGQRLFSDQLGWQQAADVVLADIEGRQAAASPPGQAVPRVAVVGALPPARTGVAAYTVRHLQNKCWQTTFYEANHCLRVAAQPDAHEANVQPVEALPAALIRQRHDTAVFVLANSSHHTKVLDALLRTRDTAARRLAYLHEAALEILFEAWLGADVNRLPRPTGLAATPTWIRRALAAKPLLGACLQFLLEHADLDGLIVNSAACRDLIRAALGDQSRHWTIDVAFLPIVPTAACSSDDAQPNGRPLRIGSFGMAGDTKHLDLLVQAARLLEQRRPIELTIAGWEARRFCRRLGISTRAGVTILESPDDHALEAAMRSVGVAIQLRSPTFGESSGVISQLLALRTPLVVTNEGSFAELPADLTRFVPAACSAEMLCDAIESAATLAVDESAWDKVLTAHTPEMFGARIAALLAPPTAAALPAPFSV